MFFSDPFSICKSLARFLPCWGAFTEQSEPRKRQLYIRLHLAGSFSKERSSFRNGGLGPSCDSGGAVCAVESGAAVPAAGAGPRGGVWEYADQRAFHFGPHHYLLRPHHHLPHRHWSSHLHRLIRFPFSDPSTTSPAPFFVASLPCSPQGVYLGCSSLAISGRGFHFSVL
nr:hypothetical protein PanWU01x14_222310 [Ipomoea batatas]